MNLGDRGLKEMSVGLEGLGCFRIIKIELAYKSQERKKFTIEKNKKKAKQYQG